MKKETTRKNKTGIDSNDKMNHNLIQGSGVMVSQFIMFHTRNRVDRSHKIYIREEEFQRNKISRMFLKRFQPRFLHSSSQLAAFFHHSVSGLSGMRVGLHVS